MHILTHENVNFACNHLNVNSFTDRVQSYQNR
jgi:hypothetical protein